MGQLRRHLKFGKNQLCLAKFIQMFGSDTKHMSTGTYHARYQWMGKHLLSHQWEALKKPLKDIDEVRRMNIDLSIDVDDNTTVKSSLKSKVKIKSEKRSTRGKNQEIAEIGREEDEESQANLSP